MSLSPCPNCDGTALYRSVKQTSAGGGYSPDLLPGLGPWYRSAKVDIVVCGDCGLMRQFASEEALERLEQSKKWELMTDG